MTTFAMATLYNDMLGGRDAPHQFDTGSLDPVSEMDLLLMDGDFSFEGMDFGVDNLDLDVVDFPFVADPFADLLPVDVNVVPASLPAMSLPSTTTSQLGRGNDLDEWLQIGLLGLDSLDPFQIDVESLGLGAGDSRAAHPAVDGCASAFTPSTVSMPTTPTADRLSVGAHPPSASGYSCGTCGESFPTQYQLSKHQRQHSKPERCPVCHVRKAALRDLHRHIWTDHKEYATEAGVPSEVRTCPVQGCGYEGRKDNIARHCKKKHGKALKWRRGEPCIV